MSDESKAQEPTVTAGPAAPLKTIEEVQAFHSGFLCGASAYARSVGHSSLKSKNETLRKVLDAQGWKTVEEFERVTGRSV